MVFSWVDWLVILASQKWVWKVWGGEVWLKFVVKCQYLTSKQARELCARYNQALSELVKMITHPDDWLLD
ncbi:hypothetical protein [Nostoc sp. CALU 546]|uniref:hypothetical protein n=1 Tax=Nostoc sp. CALU 546 TaxID=1867241 RepID=UPI003B685286